MELHGSTKDWLQPPDQSMPGVANSPGMLRTVLVFALKALPSKKHLNLRSTRMILTDPILLPYIQTEGHPVWGNFGPSFFNGLIHCLNEGAEDDIISKLVDDTEV